MRIRLVWRWSPLTELQISVARILADLKLGYDIEVETTDDDAYKHELGITENPALCIEEETIDFKDVIFQGMIPTDNEIRSIFISILWDDEDMWSWCGDGCGTCETGCHTVGK